MIINEKLILEWLEKAKQEHLQAISKIVNHEDYYQNPTSQNLQYLVDDLKELEILEKYLKRETYLALDNGDKLNVNKLDNEDFRVLVELLMQTTEKIDNDYEKKQKQGKIQGSIIDAMKKDGIEDYYNRSTKMLDIFREEWNNLE